MTIAAIVASLVFGIAVVFGESQNAVEFRVWQSTDDPESLMVSIRAEDGSWPLPTTLELDKTSDTGSHRYAEVSVSIAKADGQTSDSEPVVVATDGRPANTYSLAHLASLAVPAEPEEPAKPDPTLTVRTQGNSRFDVYLVEPTNVVLELIHEHNSREYPVTCDNRHKIDRDREYRWLSCIYSDPNNAPLWTDSWHGTRRSTYGGSSNENVEFVALSHNGAELDCEERLTNDGYQHHRHFWCYDPTAYRAWEQAVEAALAPSSDPLERYLRMEADEPPVWYQDSPYTGTGEQTTGLMRIEPYVTYEAVLTTDDENARVSGRCAPIGADGSVDWQNNHLAGRISQPFHLRNTYLCEWMVKAKGAWTLEVAPYVDGGI